MDTSDWEAYPFLRDGLRGIAVLATGTQGRAYPFLRECLRGIAVLAAGHRETGEAFTASACLASRRR